MNVCGVKEENAYIPCCKVQTIPNIFNLNGFEGSYRQNAKKIQNKIWGNLKIYKEKKSFFHF